ncbi:toxin-antitoxin system YwqK family antitoxin [Lysinibacillus capsici]|uniref:toxin-antitoxin system YwqK family antitoxin n=1 Tax=Lysinibacillus capsici TaxID=2115968 RepID=UPI001B6B9B86
MKDKILNKEYIMKNGKKFGRDFGYGGDDYDSFIVEYDQNNNEHLFTGIIYECYEDGNLANYYMVKNGVKNGKMVYYYPNGQVKEIKNIDKNTVEGIQKEFYENGVLKLIEYRVLGKLESFIKYDEHGNVLQEKNGSIELNPSYIERMDEK